MRCHSVGCGTVSQTQPVMQSDAQSSTAVHWAVIPAYDEAAA
jgi:hypothetical protein